MSDDRPTYAPELVDLEPQDTAVVRAHVRQDELATFLGIAFTTIPEEVARIGGSICGPPFGRYVPGPDGFDVEAGFPVDRPLRTSSHAEPGQLPGGPAVRVLHVGEYAEVAAAYVAAEEWRAHQHLAPAGQPWECYLDEPEAPRPRTVVYLPCAAPTGPAAPDGSAPGETRRPGPS